VLAVSAAVLVVVAARSPGPPEVEAVRAAAVTPVSARTATTLAPPAPATAAKAVPRALATGAGIAAARRYARGREGEVAFAVLDGRGRLRGLDRTVSFPSASVVKAMLLVAVLRTVGSGHLDGGTAKTLTAMITVSDNDAADAIYARVGGAGLMAVARAAHATRFRDVGYWANAQLTAADQARFFYRVDRLVPAKHRAFARKLLSSIVGSQRWGIPPAAKRHDLKAFFKGGWRTGITHQVALLVRGSRRIALAVLTSGEPSMAYGEQTIAGIAARVLE
jgi:hypothetical protein